MRAIPDRIVSTLYGRGYCQKAKGEPCSGISFRNTARPEPHTSGHCSSAPSSADALPMTEPSPGARVPRMRSRSSIEANSTTIFPFFWPRSTFTRVSKRSDSREARPVSAGDTRAPARGFFALPALVGLDPMSVTISSTDRTDSPSATIRRARLSCSSGSSSDSRALACPAERTPAASLFCTEGDSLSSRSVLVTCGRERPIRSASSS
ncbi:hypothetical protein K530_47515 [Streptomyces noursei CCRC 11814]|nr:hypothetical protein K530_47515 [Streptomyces noursei CCRC 11814]